MMSVIGNGGIGSIKKQIFLLLGLFFSSSHLGAMCPQTVGATSINEGIWNVLTRIGQATNVIESQLCALANGSGNGVADLTCTFTFGQADIGAGNIYTISVPGTYCMSEDVTFTFGTAIRVASSDVTIDMQGFTLNGANGPLAITGIILENFISNVIIKNGTIENINAGAEYYAIRDSGVAASLFDAGLINITIQDLNFNNNWAAIGLGVGVALGDTFLDGILIENCNFFGTLQGDIALVSISSIVRDCQLQNFFQILAPLLPVGTYYALVEDCVVSSTSSVQAGSIMVESDNVVLRNCIVQGPASQGIQLNGNVLTISDCTVQGGDTSSNTYGLSLIGGPAPVSAVFERCFVANSAGFYINFSNNALKLSDCVAENNAFDGFNIIGAGSNLNELEIVFERCSAQSNGLNGFVVQLAGFGEGAGFGNVIFTDCQAAVNGVCGFLMLNAEQGSFSSAAFNNCMAQINGGDGFNLDNLSNTTVSMINISFNNCVSQGNIGGGVYTMPYALASTTTYLGDGFGLNSSPSFDRTVAVSNVVFTNCVAQNNANDGFDFGGTSTFAPGTILIENISCQYCTAEQNGLHGMHFSVVAANCSVSQCLLMKNGGNGINNLNPVFGPPSVNSFLSNRSFNNAGVDYFQINDGVNGQPFYSRSTEASVQGASPWANIGS